MHELEKILEEIKEAAIFMQTMSGYGAMCVSTGAVERIIRKHMDNNNLCEKCSRRKWYQIGYKDGKNDGWIPVEERMPTKEECEKNQTGCIKFWITYGYRGIIRLYLQIASGLKLTMKMELQEILRNFG